MRDIKFRFWDSKDKEWLQDSKSETDIYDFAFKADMNWDFIDKHDAQERVVVMQYTGLKDKNDKEIYISDICQFENGDTFVLKIESWLEICVDWIGEPKCEDQARDLCRIRNAKVIGNIYENENLLENPQ